MIKSAKALPLAGSSVLAILVGGAGANADSFTVPGMYAFVAPSAGDYEVVASGASGGISEGDAAGLGAEVMGVKN
jgi:hypothetical protein